MVLHIRQAEEDAIRILREHGSSHKGVVHCFNGSPELAEEYTGMGLLLGIGGCIAMGMEEMENAVKREVEHVTTRNAFGLFGNSRHYQR